MKREIREHPAYVYNQIALRLGAILSLVTSVAVLALYPAPHNRHIALAVFLLTFLFPAVGRYVLPLARTSRQLDLIVCGYLLPVFAVQWVSITQTPEQETSTGTACLLVLSSVLFTSTRVFFAVAISSASAWLALKNAVDGPLSSNEIVQLLLVAPATAIITRFSVTRTLSALQDTRCREQASLEELKETVRKLQEATRKQQESELQLMRARKRESLGLMAAGVAHDFNNTLKAISAVSELIVLKSVDKEAREHAEEIIHAVQHASDVCRQMLTYAGRSAAVRTPLDLVQAVRSILPLLRASTPARITLDAEFSVERGLVNANETQIQQVLMNLIGNSCDAIPGEGQIRICVMHRLILQDSPVDEFLWIDRPQPGPSIVLIVSDSGCGMSSEVVNKIFDPYFTTKRSGHGFGLSNVHGIARSHQAALGVCSKPGEGTTLALYFPEVALSEQNAPMKNTNRRRVTPLSHTKRILVIDDDDLVRAPLVRMLELLGWEVVAAASGEVAVELTQGQSEFAAILLDYSMTGMNGRQTLAAIRENGCTSPAILCSGYISDPDDAVYDNEFEGFLQKPFRRQELESLLHAITGH